ncbi:MAG: hypothetical protein H6Q10_2521, partial [Acidobacteria bacterium]|nr:hypothetical protein [Acidobacteriota bacterium]
GGPRLPLRLRAERRYAATGTLLLEYDVIARQALARPGPPAAPSR